MTKYKMVQTMADVFGLPHSHIKPGGKPDPNNPPSVKRPYDTTLKRNRCEELGISDHTVFREGIKTELEKWVEKK